MNTSIFERAQGPLPFVAHHEGLTGDRRRMRFALANPGAPKLSVTFLYSVQMEKARKAYCG